MYKGYFDGASKSNPGPAAIGAYIQDSNGIIIWEVSKQIGKTTNNVAEYAALIELLTEATRRNLQGIQVYGDSQLVVKQVKGEYQVSSEHLISKQMDAELLLTVLGGKIEWIPREENTYADELSNRAFKGVSQ